MAITDQRRSALPVPFAVELPDRIPKERYYDPGFFQQEVDLLWSRTWQMACRLEEIPQADDFTEYQILDQSVLVVRTGDGGARALQNACRHRGVRVAEGRGTLRERVRVPLPRLVLRPRRHQHLRLEGPDLLRAQPASPATWTSPRCAARCGAGARGSTSTPTHRRCGECIEPFATTLDAWKMESLRAEWWYSFRLPVNWKLAEEAFLEQYHVVETHPQLVIPGRYPPRDPTTFDPRTFVESELHYLHTMSDGMAGMVHADDVAVAETLRDIELPADPALALATWQRTLNDAVVAWHRDRGCDIPDLNELEEAGLNEPMGYCFPHFFVLPDVLQRLVVPVPPARTRGDPDGDLVADPVPRRGAGGSRPRPPSRGTTTTRGVPPIPIQDFSNLPRQQRGLHARSFEYMRLSEGIEGGVANFERTVDGFLAGLPYEQLLPALRQINLNPLERPVVDLGL